MKPLGRRLIFYLRHVAEMNRLYWVPQIEKAEPDLSGLEGDAAELGEMIRAVGDAACSESAQFLEDWAAVVEPHLERIASATPGRVNWPHNDWTRKYVIRSRTEAAGAFELGLSVSDVGEAVGWVWSRGGREAEAEMIHALAPHWPGYLGRSSDVGWDAGSVLFARVRLLPEAEAEADWDRAPLVERAAAPFLAWTERVVDALVPLSAR